MEKGEKQERRRYTKETTVLLPSPTHRSPQTQRALVSGFSL
jgi:hypothetical protein